MNGGWLPIFSVLYFIDILQVSLNRFSSLCLNSFLGAISMASCCCCCFCYNYWETFPSEHNLGRWVTAFRKYAKKPRCWDLPKKSGCSSRCWNLLWDWKALVSPKSKWTCEAAALRNSAGPDSRNLASVKPSFRNESMAKVWPVRSSTVQLPAILSPSRRWRQCCGCWRPQFNSQNSSLGGYKVHSSFSPLTAVTSKEPRV